MARPLQIMTRIVPARYFVAILKGLFLKGSTMRFLIVDAIFLLIFAIVTFTVANRKFVKRIG